MFTLLNLNQRGVTQSIQNVFQEDISPTLLTISQFHKIFPYQKQIGQGAYGSIKYIQTQYGKQYALKQCKDNQSPYGIYRQVAIMKKFNHFNILKLIGFYKVKENQKLIMLTQWCKFKSLKCFSSFLSQMTFEEKQTLVLDIFHGIYVLHQKNIMHRDLKPQNILINESKRAKICDFGFCTYDQKYEISKSRKVGTPLYNSPQTQMGTYTKKCDIFSYGLIIYYIFSNGKHLFDSSSHQYGALKSSQIDFFSNQSLIIEKYKQFPSQIIWLLQKTVTQNQQIRYSTNDVLQYWIKLIRERKLNYGFFLEQCEVIQNKKILEKESENNQNNKKMGKKQQQLTLVGQIFKKNAYSLQLIQICKKYQQVSISLIKINKVVSYLKQFIQNSNSNLNKSESHLIAFGVMYFAQLKLQKIIKEGEELRNIWKQKKWLKNEKQKANEQQNKHEINDKDQYFLFQEISLKQKTDKLLDLAIRKRYQLCQNLVKITNYLLLFKMLLKNSTDFISSYLQKSMLQVHKLQNLFQVSGFNKKNSNHCQSPNKQNSTSQDNYNKSPSLQTKQLDQRIKKEQLALTEELNLMKYGLENDEQIFLVQLNELLLKILKLKGSKIKGRGDKGSQLKDDMENKSSNKDKNENINQQVKSLGSYFKNLIQKCRQLVKGE